MTQTTREIFENRLKHVPDDKRMPIIAVADTAYLAMAWLQDRELPFTAADVLRMTEMILVEERIRHYAEHALPNDDPSRSRI